MLNIERILFPTDFSTCAAQAFSHALALARATGAEVHALHVLVLNAPEWAAEQEELVNEREREVGDELTALLQGRELEGVEVEQALRRAESAGDGILAYADEEGADLIVMGTHGRQGVRRLLLGSEAEDVLRHATVPVLAVPEREPPPPEPPHPDASLDHLLVPIDFSEHSSSALAQARALAAQFGARITLLHMLERYAVPAAYGDVLPALPELTPAMRSGAEETLEAMVHSLEKDGLEADYAVKGGVTAGGIADYADKHDTDMIVMASHGRTGLRRFLSGSVTERVVRQASCPVFVLKSFGQSLVEGRSPQK